MKKKIGILFIIIVIISALAIILFYLSNKTNTVDVIVGNESYNMTGIRNNFIKYGDWLIFSNGAEEFLDAKISNYEDGIYKYNTKTGQVIQLSTSNGYGFNLRNSTLYYISQYGNINTVNLDSLETDWIMNVNDVNYLLIYDDYVYYRDSNGNNIYRINDMNGSNKRLIAEYTDGDIQIKDNNIYYLDAQNFNLFKKSIDDLSEETSKIIDESISQFYCLDDRILYLSNNQLKEYSMQDGSIKVLVENNIDSNFVVKDKKAYFYSLNDMCLKEIDIDTLEVKEILNDLDEIYRLQLYDNYIYYYDSESSNSIFTGRTIKTSLYYIDLTDNKQNNLNFNTNE